MTSHSGGCLCGALRYKVTDQPLRITFCHCRFCQRATGAPYFMVSTFEETDFAFTEGEPKVYHHCSQGSGKMIHVHFCTNCGTKLVHTFERGPGVVGVFGGTFDDPDWLQWDGANSKHILESALHGTVLPAGIPTSLRHATTNAGEPEEATVFAVPHVISRSPTSCSAGSH